MAAKLNFSPITMHSYQLSQAFGFETPGELWALRVLAWSLPAQPVIVNIGAGAGTSGLAFVETRRDAHVYTVDISPGGPNGGMQNEVNAFAVDPALALPTQILGDSKEIGKLWGTPGWPSVRPDLIFIDGDHSFAGCQGDILAWRPHLAPGGLLLFHDYTRGEWPDVYDAARSSSTAGMQFVLKVDTLLALRSPGCPVCHREPKQGQLGDEPCEHCGRPSSWKTV